MYSVSLYVNWNLYYVNGVYSFHVFMVSASGNWQENMQLKVGKMCQSYVKIPDLSDSFLHFYPPQPGNTPAAQLLGSQTYSHISRCLEDRLLTRIRCHIQIEW